MPPCGSKQDRSNMQSFEWEYEPRRTVREKMYIMVRSAKMPATPTSTASSSSATGEDGSGSNQVDNGSSFLLLNIPTEIRLRIFHWVLMMHTIEPKNVEESGAHLAPVVMNIQRVLPALPTADRDTGKTQENEQDGQNSSNLETLGYTRVFRPYRRLPTGLLRTCSQIYFEARELPFHHNLFEFEFLHNRERAGCKVQPRLRALEPWQRDSIRSVRIVLPPRGTLPGKPSAGDFEWLSQVWGRWGIGLTSMKGLRAVQVALRGASRGMESTIEYCESLGKALIQAREKETKTEDGGKVKPVVVLFAQKAPDSPN